MAAAIRQLNARLQQQETAVTVLTSERESLARQVQSLTGTTGQRVRAGVVDTRVIGQPDRFDGDPSGLVVQAEIVPRSRGSAVPARVDDDRSIVDTETQRNPRQREKRSQHTDVLHTRDDKCRSRVGQVSQRRRERRVRGLEAVRDGVGAQALNEVCVGLLMNVLGYQFRDDIPTKLAAFERTVQDYENQATKTVDDDIKIGVTILGMEDMRVKRAPHPE